jgi:antitoxin component of RelBE/YafQ-DinJ toxin-antitoxin module
MDAMVTGRMSQGKKEAGNAALLRMGTNASAAINQLYDYLIEHDRLPFPKADKPSGVRLAQIIRMVDSIPLSAGNRFATMTDDEIRRERLGSTQRRNGLP